MDEDSFGGWKKLYKDHRKKREKEKEKEGVLFGGGDRVWSHSSCSPSAAADQLHQLRHCKERGTSSSNGWRLMRKMLRSQDVHQRRLLRRQQRPSSADDDSELSPDEEEPFHFSADENNNNNSNNNNSNNSNKEDDDDDDDERKLKFSIDKILSDDFGQNDCRRYHHQHYHHCTLSTYGNRYNQPHQHHHHQHHHQQQQQQQQQQQRAHQKVRDDRLDRNNVHQLNVSDWTIREETRERGVGGGGGGIGGKGEARGTGTKEDEEEEMKRKATYPTTLKNGTVEDSGTTSSSTSSAAVFDCSVDPLPAWIFCTRYSDRPSSGPRSRKSRRRKDGQGQMQESGGRSMHGRRGSDEKRVRTCFTDEQLDRLKAEFKDNPYLTEERRSRLSKLLNLTEVQVKIWFQNKRAKMKKSIVASVVSSSSSSSSISSSAAAAAAAARGGQASSSSLHLHPLAANGFLYNCSSRNSMTDCGRRLQLQAN